MARMKVEVTALHTEKHGLSLNDRLVGYLPDYAPIASRLHMLANSLQSIWRHLPVISMIAENDRLFLPAAACQNGQARPSQMTRLIVRP